MGKKNTLASLVDSMPTVENALIEEAPTARELIDRIHSSMRAAVSKYGDRWKTISIQGVDIVPHRRFFRTTWVGIVYFSAARAP